MMWTMPALHLDEHQAAVLRAAPLSYSLPGGPAGVTPAGFRHLYYSATLARRDFDATARDLFDWRRSPVPAVEKPDIPLRSETVVLMRWGLGALSLKIPCRVLEVTPTSQRAGLHLRHPPRPSGGWRGTLPP